MMKTVAAAALLHLCLCATGECPRAQVTTGDTSARGNRLSRCFCLFISSPQLQFRLMTPPKRCWQRRRETSRCFHVTASAQSSRPWRCGRRTGRRWSEEDRAGAPQVSVAACRCCPMAAWASRLWSPGMRAPTCATPLCLEDTPTGRESCCKSAVSNSRRLVLPHDRVVLQQLFKGFTSLQDRKKY